MKKNDVLNILLLEDAPGTFRALRDRISEKLKGLVNVVPANMDESTSPNNFSYLMGLLERKEFKTIIDYFPMIDIFIIDNQILSVNTIGEEFRLFLKQSKYRRGEYKIIFCTKNMFKFSLGDSCKKYSRESKLDKGHSRFNKPFVIFG